MSPELTDLLLQALYAGHKYLLALDSSMDSIQGGLAYDEAVGREQDQVTHWYKEWRRLTKLAVALHQKETGGQP
jgi:hypothetical protein